MEITLKNVFDWIMKGIALIIVVSILAGGAAFAYSKFVATPVYRSNVKLCADSIDTDSQFINYYKAIAPQYIELLNVTEFYQMVAEETLRTTGEVYTANQVAGMVSFSAVVEETGVFYVTVSSSDPQRAYHVASAIAAKAPERISSLKPSDKLSVVSYPVLAVSPSSPNVVNNTVIGFLFGFILSAAVVILREMLDGRVKSAAEITEMYGLPVLGSVPDFSGNERKGDK